MRNALMNLLPALAATAPSLYAIALIAVALANNLSGFARVRIPSAG
jgi:hypothetical protein